MHSDSINYTNSVSKNDIIRANQLIIILHRLSKLRLRVEDYSISAQKS